MTEVAIVVAVLGILIGAGLAVYRYTRHYTCPACGIPVPDRGYCSRKCSVKDRAKELLKQLDDPNPN
jgi:hypothetical protein